MSEDEMRKADRNEAAAHDLAASSGSNTVHDEIDQACDAISNCDVVTENNGTTDPAVESEIGRPDWSQEGHFKPKVAASDREDGEEERVSIIPVGEKGQPDFEGASEDMRPDYGPFAEAAARWRDGSKAPFRATLDCVEYLAEIDEGTKNAPKIVGFEWRWLCGGLVPMATTRNSTDQGFGVYVQLRNKSGDVVTFVLPREVISDTRKLKAVLSSRGLHYKLGDVTPANSSA